MTKSTRQKLNTRNIGVGSFIFALFLALFPIDSALGNIIGSMSLNNYVAMAALLAVVLFSHKRMRFAYENVFSVIIIYLAYCIVTIVLGPDIFGSRNLVFVIYMLIAIVLGSVAWTKDEVELFRRSIILGLVVVISIVFSRFDRDSLGRLYITIGRNIDQNYLCTNLIFATAILSENITAKRYRRLSLVLLILEFVTIVMLGSRGGLLGNLVVLAVYFVLRTRHTWKVCIALIAVYFIVFVLFSDKLPSWIVERFDFKKIIHGTGSGRTIIWSDYLNKFKESSLSEKLFGHGRGIIYDRDFYRIATHNMFLKALIEGGILGLIAYGLFLLYMFCYAAKRRDFKSVAFIAGYIVSGMFLDLDDYRVFPVMIILTVMFVKNDGKRRLRRVYVDGNNEVMKLC